jgi:formamidopyrimidine-DNA glycosylase
VLELGTISQVLPAVIFATVYLYLLTDEILYQAKVHPEQRCNTLNSGQILALHLQVADVCRITVEANADDSKYPDHWLFNHRWVRSVSVR